MADNPHFIKPKSKKSSQMKRTRLIKIISAFVFGIVFILSIFVFVLTRKSFLIDSISVVASEPNVLSIKNEVESNLSGKYFSIIPKSNFLLADTSLIKDSLIFKFKNLSDIGVSKTWPNKIIISATERDRAYLWCPYKKEKNDNCFYVDSLGYIYDKSPVFSSGAYFVIYGGEGNSYGLGSIFASSTISKKEDIIMAISSTTSSTTEKIVPDYALFDTPTSTIKYDESINLDSIGKNIFSNEKNFKDFILVKNSLEKLGLRASFANLKDDFDITYKISSGGFLNLNLNDDVINTLKNLETAIDKDPLKTGLLSNKSKLEYIDLRFGNKVFYKFSK